MCGAATLSDIDTPGNTPQAISVLHTCMSWREGWINDVGLLLNYLLASARSEWL